MDTVATRYPCPSFLLDGYIKTGRFCEFIDFFVKKAADDKAEKVQWDFFLHRVWDKTYNDFKSELQTTKELREMDERKIDETVAKSLNIINNFHLEEGEE